MASTVSQMSKPDDYRRRWLEVAPKPPASLPHKKYDVFISYRSTDRDWALALYDALKASGWEPFLDQFRLVPGANLEESLQEALQASSSGVILWSSRTKDSVWCRKERQAMAKLAEKNPTFHFLFAKLDAEEIPLMDSNDLYEDFANSPEGPRGSGLVRLMFGMCGLPPYEGAVRLAQEVAASTVELLTRVKAAVKAGNADRLKEIGSSTDPGIYTTAIPLVETARGLISIGQPNEALDILARLDQEFPDSLAAKQLRGLALRRTKRYQEAVEVMSELTESGHQDAETLGILAAALDGRFQETGKALFLRRSRELYRTAFQADKTSYYTGINAAAKSLFLGEPDEAARIAALVEPLVKGANDGKDFWAGCTLAEIFLLQRKLPDAETQYQKMIDCFGERGGDLESTKNQARRVCEALKLTQSEADKVLAPFNLL